MPGSFIDTNVLAYLASSDAAKATRARNLVADGAVVSVQVLNELANVARRKMRLPWADLRTLLNTLRDLLSVHPLDAAVHDRGLNLAERYGFSIYDAMIVAAASEAGCVRLWSEDMQHGMTLPGGLIILNPFRDIAG